MALIPPFFFDCVVAIGQQDADTSISWIGTGFLFGKFIKTDSDNIKTYKVYLVTNRHVLKERNSILVRFNAQEENPVKDYVAQLIDENGKESWTGHPNKNIDVAVLATDGNKLQEDGAKFRFFTSDDAVFTKKMLMEMETSEGDFIYVLGFPMGLVSDERQHILLRSGAISRIRDLFEGRSTDYLIDAFVFPGNSGGPVIIKPEFISIQGTKYNPKAGLIGMIESYLSYGVEAQRSKMNTEPTVFNDNTGLSRVVPTDYILETIEEDEKLKRENPST